MPALLTASPGGGTDLVAVDNLSGNALERPDPDDPISQAADLISQRVAVFAPHGQVIRAHTMSMSVAAVAGVT